MTKIDESDLFINIETGFNLGPGILDIVVYCFISKEERIELRETFSSKLLPLDEFMAEISRMKKYMIENLEEFENLEELRLKQAKHSGLRARGRSL